MDKHTITLLNEAGIPYSVRRLSFTDEKAPARLNDVAIAIAEGENEFYDGVILVAGEKVSVLSASKIFAVLAKTVVENSLDGYYATPLQTIAKASQPREDNEVYDRQHLFIDTFYDMDGVCPYSDRERSLLRELIQHRYFSEKSTSILSFGTFKRSNSWYDRTLVGLFDNHTEVSL
jgi:hypothetical protein